MPGGDPAERITGLADGAFKIDFFMCVATLRYSGCLKSIIFCYCAEEGREVKQKCPRVLIFRPGMPTPAIGIRYRVEPFLPFRVYEGPEQREVRGGIRRRRAKGNTRHSLPYHRRRVRPSMDQKAKRARKIRCDLTDDARTSGSPALSSSQSSKTCIFFRADLLILPPLTIGTWRLPIRPRSNDGKMDQVTPEAQDREFKIGAISRRSS